MTLRRIKMKPKCCLMKERLLLKELPISTKWTKTSSFLLMNSENS